MEVAHALGSLIVFDGHRLTDISILRLSRPFSCTGCELLNNVSVWSHANDIAVTTSVRVGRKVRDMKWLVGTSPHPQCCSILHTISHVSILAIRSLWLMFPAEIEMALPNKADFAVAMETGDCINDSSLASPSLPFTVISLKMLCSVAENCRCDRIHVC